MRKCAQAALILASSPTWLYGAHGEGLISSIVKIMSALGQAVKPKQYLSSYFYHAVLADSAGISWHRASNPRPRPARGGGRSAWPGARKKCGCGVAKRRNQPRPQERRCEMRPASGKAKRLSWLARWRMPAACMSRMSSKSARENHGFALRLITKSFCSVPASRNRNQSARRLPGMTCRRSPRGHDWRRRRYNGCLL